MTLFYVSIGFPTVLSNIVYHLSQKLTSASIHPLFALSVSYGLRQC